MNGLERTLRILAGEPTDRPPISLHNFLMAGEMLHLPLDEHLTSSELLAEAQINAWERFGHDVLMVENGVAAMAEAIGCEVAYRPDIPPHVRRCVVEHPGEVSRLSIPDPEQSFPLNELIEGVRLIKKHMGNDAFVMGRSDQGPMALAAAIYGPEKLVMDISLGQSLEDIHRLIDFCVHCTMELASAMKQAGADGTCIGGYGLSMVNPEIYRTFELPYQKKFVEHCHRLELPVGIHTCGREDAILNDLVSTGADWLELAHCTTLALARDATKDHCGVLGMIDQANMLMNQTPQVIFDQCTQCLETMRGSRFLPGPGCALPADCPPEHLDAMIRAIRQFEW